MQSPIWKIVTAIGIIGIGTMVVLEVQHRLPPLNANAVTGANALLGTNGDAALAGAQLPPGSEHSVIPDDETDFDRMFSGEPTQPDGIANPSGNPDSAVDTTVRRSELSSDPNPFAAEAAVSAVRTAAATDETIGSDVRTASYQQEVPFSGDLPPFPVEPQEKPAATGDTAASAAPFEFPELNATPAPFAADSSQSGTSQSAPSLPGNSAATAAPATNPDSVKSVRNPTAAATGRPNNPLLFLNGKQDAVTPTGGPAVTAQKSEPFLSDFPAANNQSPPAATTGGQPAFSEDSTFSPFDEPKPVSPGEAPRPVPATNSPATVDDVPFFRADENAGSTTSPVRQDTGGIPEFPPLNESTSQPRPGDPLDRPSALPFPEMPERTSPEIGDSAPFTEDSATVPGSSGGGTPGNNVRPGADPLDFPVLDSPPRSTPRDGSPGGFGDGSSSVRPPSATADTSTISEVMRPHLSIRKDAPPSASVGVPLDYVITVSNDGQSSAYDVIVEDEMSRAVELVTTKPTAELDRATRKLSWRFDELRPAEKREITVRVTPTGEGTLNGLATVRFKAQVKATTVITAPKLTLKLTGPPEKQVGDEVTLRYLIRNEGSGDATNVLLRSVLPKELRHSEGSDLEYEIESLARNEEREVVLTVIAAEKGQIINTAEVTSAGQPAASAQLQINIIGEQLKLERLGPERRYVGRAANFQNIISNETNFESVNAVVRESVPDGMKFVAAAGGDYNPETRQISWRIDRLAPGKQVVFDVELAGESSGTYDTVVEVVENAGFTSRATKSLTIDDLHNVGADISRLDGPIPVGEKFAFSITIQNRGTAVANEVMIELEAPSQIRILAAGNKKDGIQARPVDRRNAVAFDRVVRIAPNESKTFDLLLQGQEPIRNGQIKAKLNYAEMQEPLVVSESVTVYSEP